MDVETSIQMADYVVCVVVLLIPMAIGILFAVKDAKKATREEYLFGGRRMSVVPVALSLFVTFISAIALMGNPADIYSYSVMVITLYGGYSISYVISLFAIVPLFYSLQLTSIYQYFELRFHSRAVRISALTVGIKTAGGWSEAWPLAVKGGRVSFDVYDFDPRAWYYIQPINHPKIVTMRDAKISYILNIPIMLAYGVLLFFVGFAIYVHFAFLRCDPYEGGLITNRNQLSPFFVMQAFQDMPGFAGLFMGTMFSGSLSTISSGISALAANTVEDILSKCLSGFKESSITQLTKVLVCLYRLAIVGLAYVADSIDGPVTQMSSSVFGACGGPVFGVFILGACIPWSNKYGALGGGGLALVFNVWLAITGQMYGKKTRPLQPPSIENCYTNSSMLLNLTSTILTAERFPNDNDSYSYGFFLYDISYIWYGFIGCFVAFTSGALISFCFKKYDHTKTDPRLIIPIIRKAWSLTEPEAKQEESSATMKCQLELLNCSDDVKFR
ncbi:sodium-coupled monocarboxylate transporter 2-like [Physella acuta]|uniref:sodium-coupled monocarboxylate transporter 2-like n=1 Tax=Physella acuta TaxID=109671 RepID=UPI0027DAFAB2|nr:sodium-coupled monocarboxylate transporter 2-like [Physella acuta]